MLIFYHTSCWKELTTHITGRTKASNNFITTKLVEVSFLLSHQFTKRLAAANIHSWLPIKVLTPLFSINYLLFFWPDSTSVVSYPHHWIWKDDIVLKDANAWGTVVLSIVQEHCFVYICVQLTVSHFTVFALIPLGWGFTLQEMGINLSTDSSVKQKTSLVPW